MQLTKVKSHTINFTFSQWFVVVNQIVLDYKMKGTHACQLLPCVILPLVLLNYVHVSYHYVNWGY